MTLSYLDKMQHTFTCESPKCGESFKKVLRDLLYTEEVACPKCGMAIDIRVAKRTGEIGKAFDTADQLDKQAAQKK